MDETKVKDVIEEVLEDLKSLTHVAYVIECATGCSEGTGIIGPKALGPELYN